MESNNHRPLLDSLVDSKELQILKTIIPYLHESQQKTFAIGIRFIEFIKTTELFDAQTQTQNEELYACAGESNQERMVKMLHAIKQYCNDHEQEQIDMLINVCEVSDGFKYF